MLLEAFSVATTRQREKDERLKMKERRTENKYSLDPLLESLLVYTSEQDLSRRLRTLFYRFDIHEIESLCYQELYEGLHHLEFDPPIQLRVQEYNVIFQNFSDGTGHVDLRGFEMACRAQLKFFCLRRLGNLISTMPVLCLGASLPFWRCTRARARARVHVCAARVQVHECKCINALTPHAA